MARSPARALVSRAALAHNLARLREAASGSRVLAVVKADGYGHGAGTVAAALAGADGFGVARVHEGLELRAAGVSQPIVVLSGAWTGADIEAAAGAGLDVVVHHGDQLRAFESVASERPPRAWLKVDTGMHRLGFAPDAVRGAHARLAHAQPVLMTHLANADDRDDGTTREQMRAFQAACADLAGERSAANSAGALGWPETRGDWVRPGIALYGISPFAGGTGAELGLRPAMTLETRLVAVKRVRRGGAVGYGGTWVCPEDMPIGVAAIGYGDGYPRHAPSGTPVLVGDVRAALVGRVSMDLVTIDLRECPDARPGERVVLWGEGLAVEEVAAEVDTIGYELVTRVAARVERVVE